MCDLKSRLSDLLLAESLSDVVFDLEDGGAPFPCHRLVLALGSKVFEAMLYGKMAATDVITVTDVTRQGFNVMLRYLYRDEVVISCQSEAFEAAYAARKYMVDGLFAACERWLLRHAELEPGTVVTVLEEAAFLDMERLKGRCMRYISRHAGAVFQSRSLVGASADTLRSVLQLDLLLDVESESEVLECVWLWGEGEKGAGDVRRVTRWALPHVRLLSLSSRELERVLGRFPLLDEEETLAALFSVGMPGKEEASLLDGFLCGETRNRCGMSACSRLDLPTDYRYDGSLTVFTIERQLTTAHLTVTTAHQVTLVGFEPRGAWKPIPCYSSPDRRLDAELRVGNAATRLQSSLKDEEEDELLVLDEFVVVSEGETVRLVVELEGEGVRVTQWTEREFSSEVGEAIVKFRIDGSGDKAPLFPFKQIVCFVQPSLSSRQSCT